MGLEESLTEIRLQKWLLSSERDGSVVIGSIMEGTARILAGDETWITLGVSLVRVYRRSFGFQLWVWISNQSQQLDLYMWRRSMLVWRQTKHADGRMQDVGG